MSNESINWDKLGFDYIKTDKRYLSVWRNGEWDKGTLTDDNVLHISEGSTALHYGQQCFEGLKAYRCKDGSINLFRPDQNAARQVEQATAITLHAPTPQRHAGREVLALQALRLPHGTRKPLDLRLCLGQRLGLIGTNGSGKSTLLRLLNGELPASPDTLRRSGETALLDQHCSTLAGHSSVLEHLRQANPVLAQGELRSRLAQLGLDAARVELPSSLLSGGERMKAALAAVLYRERPLDLLLLDEPGNHLDLPSLAALERMLEQFRGALMVASHDVVLLENLALDEYLRL